MERGEPAKKVAQSFLNAGYSPTEINAALQSLGIQESVSENSTVQPGAFSAAQPVQTTNPTPSVPKPQTNLPPQKIAPQTIPQQTAPVQPIPQPTQTLVPLSVPQTQTPSQPNIQTQPIPPQTISVTNQPAQTQEQSLPRVKPLVNSDQPSSISVTKPLTNKSPPKKLIRLLLLIFAVLVIGGAILGLSWTTLFGE